MPNRPAPISTTLRQKLTSLTSPVAPSFSSTPATFAPTSMGPAKKRGLLASWLRGSSKGDNTDGRTHDGSTSSSSGGVKTGGSGKGKEREWDAGEIDEDLQRIMNAVIFNGGLDFDTRPMVVVTAAALPDPNKVNYDLLLNSILSYLDLYVEADYCVVFLAAGGRYSPGWSWIWKAYRSLSRKYRKNLKRLYIVHSSGFTRMLFSLAGAMISPKFYAKIEYVGTLSDLARHVPITQMNIHPAVYSENLKYEREITVPAGYQTASRVFGVSLDELMGHDGESGGIPRPVKEAITYLRMERGDGSTPMEEHGLFRRSPSSALLKQVQGAYDRGQVVDLVQFGDANLAAVLIKKFFRSLPDPIFPDSMFATIRKCPNPNLVDNWDDAISYVREKILGELEGNKQVLLNVVLHLLHDVSVRSSINLMDAYNLAIVFTPNLVSNDNPIKAVQMSMVSSPDSTSQQSKDIAKGQTTKPLASQPSAGGPVGDNAAPQGTTLGTVIRFCIEHYYEIFDEVRDVSEAVPEEAFEVSSKDLPTSAEPVTPKPSDLLGTAAKRSTGNRQAPPSSSTQQQQQPAKFQGRVRGPAGPPPSAASASMALLAKALAEGSPQVQPTENTSLLQRNRTHSYGPPGPAPPGPGQSQVLLRPDTDVPHLSVDRQGWLSSAQSVSFQSGSAGGGPSRSGWTGSRGPTGVPKTRSIISIEKDPLPTEPRMIGTGSKVFSGRESIKLGKATITSGGTVRKSASAGVMGVGVTATGFFTSPQASSS